MQPPQPCRAGDVGIAVTFLTGIATGILLTVAGGNAASFAWMFLGLFFGVGATVIVFLLWAQAVVEWLYGHVKQQKRRRDGDDDDEWWKTGGPAPY